MLIPFVLSHSICAVRITAVNNPVLTTPSPFFYFWSPSVPSHSSTRTWMASLPIHLTAVQWSRLASALMPYAGSRQFSHTKCGFMLLCFMKWRIYLNLCYCGFNIFRLKVHSPIRNHKEGAERVKKDLLIRET